MSKPLPKLSIGDWLRYRGEALVFFAFIGFFRLFPLDIASAIGGWIGRVLLYRVGNTNRARINLKNAYPEKSSDEIEAIIVEMWDNLGRVAAEYAHLKRLKLHGNDPRLSVTGTQYAEPAIASGKGVIFVSGHFANW